MGRDGSSPESSRRLHINAASLTLAALMTRASGVVIIPVVAHHLGATALGQFQLATALVGYFSVLALFGLTPLVVRTMSVQPGDIPSLFWRVLVNRLILSGIAQVLMLAVVAAVGYPASTRDLLLILGAGLAANACADAASMVLQARERMLPILVTTGVQSVLYAGLGALLVWNGAGLYVLAAVLSGSAIVRCVALVLIVVRAYAPFVGSRQLLHGWSLLRTATPFFLSTALIVLVARVDVFILSLLLPLREVGFYTAGYLMLDVAIMVPNAIAQAAYPVLARQAQGDTVEFRATTTRSYQVVSWTCVAAAGAVFLTAPLLISILFGPGFHRAVPVLRLVILSLAFIAYNTTVGRSVFAAGGQRSLLIASGVGATFNIIGNLILISYVGIIGAAMMTVATYALLAALHAEAAGHYGCRPSPWVSVRPLLALALVVAIVEVAGVLA